jgi:hypothetical protein
MHMKLGTSWCSRGHTATKYFFVQFLLPHPWILEDRMARVARLSRGFLRKNWDSSFLDQAPSLAIFCLVLFTLNPRELR